MEGSSCDQRPDRLRKIKNTIKKEGLSLKVRPSSSYFL